MLDFYEACERMVCKKQSYRVIGTVLLIFLGVYFLPWYGILSCSPISQFI